MSSRFKPIEELEKIFGFIYAVKNSFLITEF